VQPGCSDARRRNAAMPITWGCSWMTATSVISSLPRDKGFVNVTRVLDHCHYQRYGVLPLRCLLNSDPLVTCADRLVAVFENH
jgi:hypothetical protein